MSDQSASGEVPDEWAKVVDQANEAFLGAMEGHAKAQAAFVESWNDALTGQIDDSTAHKESLDSFATAWDIWADASEEQYQQLIEGLEAGEVSSEDLRDVWLSAANDAFKEIMGTTGYAAATGNAVEAALTAQREADAAAQETLEVLGFATRDDITEVGSRLVELERRQHSVEKKLDRVLAQLEEP